MPFMHRIYYDPQFGPDAERYGLGVNGAIRDMAPISDQLRDGLRVTLYTPDLPDVEATLEFDHVWGWTARPTKGEADA